MAIPNDKRNISPTAQKPPLNLGTGGGAGSVAKVVEQAVGGKRPEYSPANMERVQQAGNEAPETPVSHANWSPEEFIRRKALEEADKKGGGANVVYEAPRKYVVTSSLTGHPNPRKLAEVYYEGKEHENFLLELGDIVDESVFHPATFQRFLALGTIQPYYGPEPTISAGDCLNYEAPNPSPEGTRVIASPYIKAK